MDGGRDRGSGSGIFGLEIPLGRPWRKSKLGYRYREQGEQEEKDRVVFVWVLGPTTGLLSEQSGMVGGVFSPRQSMEATSRFLSRSAFQCWP